MIGVKQFLINLKAIKSFKINCLAEYSANIVKGFIWPGN